MRYDDLMTTEALEELSDSDLLVIASSKGKIRIEGSELCFNGLRYGILTDYPVELVLGLRGKIIKELVDTRLD